jgi:hypothetical protein
LPALQQASSFTNSQITKFRLHHGGTLALGVPIRRIHHGWVFCIQLDLEENTSLLGIIIEHRLERDKFVRLQGKTCPLREAAE